VDDHQRRRVKGVVMNPYSWLVLFHIVAAMLWIGGSVALNVLGARARASADPSSRIEFVRSLGYVGPRVLAPSVVAVVVLGVWMVLSNEAWSFSQPWIVAGLALWLASLLFGGAYLGRVGIQLQRSVDADGGDAPETRRLLDRWILGSRVLLLILLVVAWDMVFKPGL
jgi:putative membrane protein